MKITLIGRPGPITSSPAGTITTTMQSSSVPTLPKGVPAPPPHAIHGLHRPQTVGESSVGAGQSGGRADCRGLPGRRPGTPRHHRVRDERHDQAAAASPTGGTTAGAVRRQGRHHSSGLGTRKPTKRRHAREGKPVCFPMLVILSCAGDAPASGGLRPVGLACGTLRLTAFCVCWFNLNYQQYQSTAVLRYYNVAIRQYWQLTVLQTFDIV